MVMLNVIMLSVVMLNVIMLSAVMLNVLALFSEPSVVLSTKQIVSTHQKNENKSNGAMTFARMTFSRTTHSI
jgi:hypothetical protein